MIGFRTRGTARTVVFLLTGYLIAWISEASSIRTGFPYGWYFYIDENLKGEILNWGVPVWDSLSYTFLCFAGLSLAELLMRPPLPLGERVGVRWSAQIDHSPSPVSSPQRERTIRIKTSILAAFFVTILDIIVDPLAHLGDQWFLGKVYYYPNPGFYFDVPFSNFAGWFFVAFVIVGINLFIDRLLQRSTIHDPRLPAEARRAKEGSTFFAKYSGPALYFGIFLFNWGITLWIRQWRLALMDLVWMAIPGYLFYRHARHPKKN